LQPQPDKEKEKENREKEDQSSNVSNTFIDSYLHHTLIYETPLSFWKWSAYSTISTVLKDRCYIKSGDSFIFPNLYVLFIAESSGHRKNRPVELSQDLASKIKSIKTISGRASVQAILDELAQAETDAVTGKVIKSSSATFFSPELSASIVSDPDGLRILTDIYDYKTNPYKSRLRTGPNFNLDRIVFSMLSASNQDMLTGLFDQSIIRGGFIARTLLIMPNEFRKPNSLLRLDHEVLKLSKEHVLSQLRSVSQLFGEFKLEEESILEYESWYNPFREAYLKRRDRTGIIGRIHTHILKLSMILAANDLSQCILKRHIEQAIEECLNLMPNYDKFTMSNAKSEIGAIGGTVITELLSAKDYMLSRKVIIRNNWQAFDMSLLDKAVVALEEAGMIKQHQTKDGIFYQLTKTCLDMLQ
jgi:hypothetical protein